MKRGAQGKTGTLVSNPNMGDEVELQVKVVSSLQSCTLCPEPGDANRHDTGDGGEEAQLQLLTSTGDR